MLQSPTIPKKSPDLRYFDFRKKLKMRGKPKTRNNPIKVGRFVRTLRLIL